MSTVWYSGTGALSDQEMHELIEIEELNQLMRLKINTWFFHFSKCGVVRGLLFDICDIRTICLDCGNGVDCCVCPENYRKRHLELIDSGEFASS